MEFTTSLPCSDCSWCYRSGNYQKSCSWTYIQTSVSLVLLPNFQILNIFVTHFSGTVFKLDTHTNNGWCIVYTAIKLLLLLLLIHPFFFFHFSFQFSKIKIFHHTVLRNCARYWKLVIHVDCERLPFILLLLPIHPFLHFSFSSFQTFKFFI